MNVLLLTTLPTLKACNSFLDSVAPSGATLSNKIHGFFLYVTHRLIFSKRVRREMPSQREDDNGLNRQLGEPRIVYGVRSIFVWGGGMVYRGG